MIVRWIALCAVAEFFGIALAAIWYGIVAVTFGEPVELALRIGVWLLATMSAIPEGFVLGGLQAYGLRWFYPTLSATRWITMTTLVGLAGWGVGTFMPLFMVGEAASAPEPSPTAIAAFAAIFGSLAGVAFGAAQAFALPVGADGRVKWVIANVIGWALGLPLIYLAAQLAGDFQAPAAMVAIWATGGLGAGVCVGVATAVAIATTEARKHPLVSIPS